MPQIKEVPRLEMLSLKTITTSLISLPFKIGSDDWRKPFFQKHLNDLSDALLTYVPVNLYDSLFFEVIKAFEDLEIRCGGNTWAPYVKTQAAVKLIEVILNRKLRHLDLPQWTDELHDIIDNNLSKLTGLVALNLTSFQEGSIFSDRQRKILSGIKTMTNLRHVCILYYCTDDIIKAISENCLQIRSIDITGSWSTTCQSVDYLLKCKRLQKMQLYGTSISEEKYARLVSHLPNLQDIGNCDNMTTIVKYLDQPPYSHIKRLIIQDMQAETLSLLIQFFPQLECLSLTINNNIYKTVDFSRLIHFTCLRKLTLFGTYQMSQSFTEVIKVIGENLDHLHLENFQLVSLDSIMKIGKYCPNLRSLVFHDITYVRKGESVTVSDPHSFAKLESLFWKVLFCENLLNPLTLILSKAVNIKYVHLYSVEFVNFTDFQNILRINEMKYLTELRISPAFNMDMKTAKMVIDSCSQLKVFAKLDNLIRFCYIDISEYIKQNNLELDISSPLPEEPRCCEPWNYTV